MALTKDAFRQILQQFLPEGLAWTRAPDSVLARLLNGMAGLCATLDMRLTDLLSELNPATSNEMLPDWEAFAGAIDSCSAAGGTLDERRARVVAKLQEQGGLSRAYFLQLAEALGYVDTTITEFRPSTCEMSCEGPVIDESWRFLWQVNLPHEGDNHSVFRADSACTERVDTYVFGILECRFVKLKPAHTYVRFTYEGL